MRSGAGNAQGELDFMRDFVLRRARIDAEVAALYGKGGADDQQIALEVWDALGELVFEIGKLDRSGHLFRYPFDRERSHDLRGGLVAGGFDVLELFCFKGDVGVLRHIQPLAAVKVFFHHRVGHVQGRRGHDQFAMAGRWIFRVECDGAGDAIGAALSGFKHGIELEHDVVDALGVFEVEGLRRGKRGAGQGGEANHYEEWFFHNLVLCCCFIAKEQGRAPEECGSQ